MLRYLLLFNIVLSFVKCYSQTTNTPLNYRVANWFNNKKCAVSITFDDNCPGQFLLAVPAMNSRGIKGTFFVNTGINGGCTTDINWPYVNKAATTGHEIGAHTVNHVNLPQISDDSARYEMKANRDTINVHVPTQKCLTLAYPFGAGGGRTTREQQIRQIASQYFIGARGAGASELGYNPYNQDKNRYFTMFYFQVESLAMSQDTSLKHFTNYVDSTIHAGGWFLPQYHGIGSTGGFADVDSISFNNQMEVIKNRIDNIWSASFGSVLSYHKERRSHSLKIVSEDSKAWVLRLTDTLPNDKFNQALTLRIKKPNFTITSVSQGINSIDVKNDGDTIQINAVPDGGDIVFNKTTITANTPIIEDNFSLEQNIPNPFTNSTSISYSLSKDQYVRLDVFNYQGELIKTLIDENQKKGKYTLEINSVNMIPGIYFYRIANGTDTKRMVLIK